jgi:hypothetical protein
VEVCRLDIEWQETWVEVWEKVNGGIEMLHMKNPSVDKVRVTWICMDWERRLYCINRRLCWEMAVYTSEPGLVRPNDGKFADWVMQHDMRVVGQGMMACTWQRVQETKLCTWPKEQETTLCTWQKEQAI